MREDNTVLLIFVLTLGTLLLVLNPVLAEYDTGSLSGSRDISNETMQQPSSITLEKFADVYRIGVLANRGPETARKEWSRTAGYLSRELEPDKFEIVPLSFDETMQLSGDENISFLIANPSVYSYLEYYGRALAIATNLVPGYLKAQPVFGGVIFTRSDRNDIQKLSDLKGKRFSAVDKNSLGGWQAGLKELMDNSIVPEKDFIILDFTGTQDASVQAVLNGDADAGTVRSTQLERMDREGILNLSEIKVLNNQSSAYPHYPYLLSTSLYPEWSFAAMAGTDSNLAKRVAVALFRMKQDNPAAKAAQGAGWTIPQDTTPVHGLLRELHLPPYDNQENTT